MHFKGCKTGIMRAGVVMFMIMKRSNKIAIIVIPSLLSSSFYVSRVFFQDRLAIK